MKRYEYDSYKASNETRFARAWIAASDRSGRRAVRSRPRSPEETRLLDRLAIDAWQGAIRSGELEIVAPRRYRIHVRKGT